MKHVLNITRGAAEYAAPSIDKIEIAVEKGFANSFNDNGIDDAGSSNWGSGEGDWF